jgi:hypothetical protein
MQKDSYNRGGYIAFLFSMVFSLLFFVYITIFHPGIDLKEVTPAPAPGAEQKVAEATAAEVDISKIEKPGSKTRTWLPMAPKFSPTPVRSAMVQKV